MAKSVHNDFLDGALDILRLNADGISVCDGEPGSYADAWTNNALATSGTMTSADYTIADGDTSGRKITVGTQSDIPIFKNGTADHIALVDTGNSKLLLVTTCSDQVLTSGGTVTVNEFDDEILDPS